ncbi:hypothetical protein PUN28_016043 [Cardiocondyla obscurior]|uniref:Uncharacterized protein n=1 Tax=Cardiocondyla obscurior TaxID=286306 RepID=A0AAW2EVY3_9HYME
MIICTAGLCCSQCRKPIEISKYALRITRKVLDDLRLENKLLKCSGKDRAASLARLPALRRQPGLRSLTNQSASYCRKLFENASSREVESMAKAKIRR